MDTWFYLHIILFLSWGLDDCKSSLLWSWAFTFWYRSSFLACESSFWLTTADVSVTNNNIGTIILTIIPIIIVNYSKSKIITEYMSFIYSEFIHVNIWYNFSDSYDTWRSQRSWAKLVVFKNIIYLFTYS